MSEKEFDYEAYLARRVAERPKDLGKKAIAKLKRLEGDELEAELRDLIKIAGDPSESMGFLGSRRLRAGFLIIEHSVKLSRDKRTQLIAELEALIPENSRSRNFHLALARWHNAELRIDLKGQLEILADKTVPQFCQEEVLRSVLEAEIELGHEIVDVIEVWHPKQRPSSETLICMLDRIMLKHKRQWYADISEKHMEVLFGDWRSWFAWYFQTMLYGNRFGSPNEGKQQFWYFLFHQVKDQEPYLRLLALQFVYEHLFHMELSDRENYLYNVWHFAKKWGYDLFAARLQREHDLVEPDRSKFPSLVLS